MSLPVALVGLLNVAALVGVGALVHRGLTQIAEQVRPSGVQQELDRFWEDLQGALAHYATSKRVHDLEAQLTQLQHAHNQLLQTNQQMAATVNWMYRLVRAWSGQGEQP